MKNLRHTKFNNKKYEKKISLYTIYNKKFILDMRPRVRSLYYNIFSIGYLQKGKILRNTKFNGGKFNSRHETFA